MKYIKTETILNTWHTYSDDTGEYIADIVMFDEPSKYGIDGGKISKLNIHHKKNVFVALCNYDRGFDILPKEEVKDFYNEIIRTFN